MQGKIIPEVLDSKMVGEISLQRNISHFSNTLATKGSLIKSQTRFKMKSFSKCSAQELSLEAQITTSAIESHAVSG